MIQVTPQMRIMVAIEPADFRKGIDGIAQLCRADLSADPFSGTVFVFRNRRKTAVKILIYDGRGFWLCHKRLSTGKFIWWPGSGNGRIAEVEAHQLAVLLCAGDPELVEAAPVWRPVAPSAGHSTLHSSTS
ncbi:IS66 family insertion sequence element accessory protein TnpB [Myxococcota bacterium]